MLQVSTFTVRASNVWTTFRILNNNNFWHRNERKKNLTLRRRTQVAETSSHMEVLDNRATFWLPTWIPPTLNNYLAFTWMWWGGGCSGRSLPLILLHTRALMTYLSRGYLPCWKDYKVWFFLTIKVNTCILIHPISIYKFWGESLKISYFIYTAKEIEKNFAIQRTC